MAQLPDGDPRRNQLLAHLPPGDLALLADDLAPVELATGRVLHTPGQSVDEVYFPLIGVVSIVATFPDAEQTVEVATVGDEGMVGLSVFLGAGPPTERAMVQVPGHA